MKIKRGSAKFLLGLDKIEQLERLFEQNPNMIGMAFVGRSNVGKSSLINNLFGNKTARTSKTPGRTREINVFSFETERNEEEKAEKKSANSFLFFDLPGYGHAEVSKEMIKNWQDLMNYFFKNLPLSICLLNIQDARHPDQKADQIFHEFLKDTSSETILAFNKIDKLKKQKEKASLNKKKKEIFQKYKWVKHIHFVSAESGEGIPPLEQALLAFCHNQI